MKIHILFDFREGPWGGGNQFLKNLRKYLHNQGAYTSRATDANVILFNYHHKLDEAFKLKKKYPEKVFVHRLDGPLSLTRGFNREIDDLVYAVNREIADGTIFQSKFAEENVRSLGYQKNKYETVIPNSADSQIFRPIKKETPGKIRLITTSWAAHWNKGFKIYQFLDENLDFNKYDYTLIGNSPVSFKNIKLLKPLESEKLACKLQEADIFITASRNDPCSNSLIEALSCGLPAVALRDGGHPELVGKGGELFKTSDECVKKIDRVANNLKHYQKEIKLTDAPQAYLHFIQKVKAHKRVTSLGYAAFKGLKGIAWLKNIKNRLSGAIS